MADCTIMFVLNLESVRNTLDLLEKFLGMKINKYKTNCIYIGSQRHRKDKHFGLNFSDKIVSTLGVKMSGNEIDNFKPRVLKILNILDSWRQRKLTII